MEWVLIIMLTAWNTRDAASVDHVEFQTERACELAEKQLTIPQLYILTTVCVKKDD